MTEQPAPGRPSVEAGDAENATPVDQRAWLTSRLPEVGRVFRGSARVRLGDARPGRRARLDALARLLQDVAEDDAADADLGDDVGWMLRRTAMVVERVPVLGEHLELATFCSATGGRWAERTTLVTGERGARVTTRAVWVAIDRRSGAPVRLDERFEATYGPSAGGRRVRLRLELPGPGEGARHTEGRPWPLRVADLDVWGHANNAVAWAAVEEALDEDPPEPFAAVVEHPTALFLDAAPRLLVVAAETACQLWLVGGADSRVLAAGWFGPRARVARPGSPVAGSSRGRYGGAGCVVVRLRRGGRSGGGSLARGNIGRVPGTVVAVRNTVAPGTAEAVGTRWRASHAGATELEGKR